MAIIAGKYDFDLQRRSDHTEFFRITDGNDAAVNLTGYTIAAQAWSVVNEKRHTKYADFTVAYTNRSNGEFTLSLSHTQTATFSLEKLKYDVLLTNSSGKKEYYIEGTIFISEGVTST
tara:strand:+ start:76 stop:429 length:354 start_codon:yes stop_codon:yes gene_type:complete